MINAQIVWAACPYVNDRETCLECLEWEDPVYGKCKLVCYALSEEVCRAVLTAAEEVAARKKVLQELADLRLDE